MEQLSNFIRSKINIDNTDLAFILSHFKEITVKKNRFILKKNQFSTNYYFIKSGGLRVWFEKERKPITAWLFFENDFFSELSSLKTGKGTQYNVQAITDSVLLVIDKNSMEHLYKTIPKWQCFGRLLWENAFLKVTDGIIRHQTLTAEERYLAAMQYSNLMQKIPLKQLASFLGMTPTSLSRIRKKITL